VTTRSNIVYVGGSDDPTGLKDVNVSTLGVLCFLCEISFFLLVSFGFCCSGLFYVF
jgi:hypothetical protein